MYALCCCVDKDSNPVFGSAAVGLGTTTPSANWQRRRHCPQANEDDLSAAFPSEVNFYGMSFFDAKYDA